MGWANPWAVRTRTLRLAMETRSTPKEIIFGIDPGTLVVGYGAVVMRGKRATLLAAGVIRATPKAPIATRLATIRQGLDEILAKVGPKVVVIERAFASENVASALRIGEGRGVALSSAALCGARIEEYTPAEVKKALTGNGGADKGIVGRCVAAELRQPEGLPGLPLDATDALALALTWARRQHLAHLGLS